MLTSRSPSQHRALDWLAEREVIPVVAWSDPSGRFAPTDSYVEMYWLPILGPSATWSIRRIAALLDTAPVSGLWLPLGPFAASLGLPGRAGRRANIRSTLDRLVGHGLARLEGAGGYLAVRNVLPPLNKRLVDRLPPGLADRHRRDHPDRSGSAIPSDRELGTPVATGRRAQAQPGGGVAQGDRAAGSGGPT